jgi:hypothetical protein
MEAGAESCPLCFSWASALNFVPFIDSHWWFHYNDHLRELLTHMGAKFCKRTVKRLEVQQVDFSASFVQAAKYSPKGEDNHA